MVTQQSKHGYPPTKINYILQSLKNLQPNKEFDSSAAQLVVLVLVPRGFLVNFHNFGLFWEITVANDSIMGEKGGQMAKNFLNSQKFPQAASERLDLFSCLMKSWIFMKF